MRDQKTKDSFIKYMNEHPEERFWQAVSNWYGSPVFTSGAGLNHPDLWIDTSNDKEKSKDNFIKQLEDMFYREDK